VYGLEAFDAAVWCAGSVDDLPSLEILAISDRNSYTPNGFNLTRGGGVIHTATHSAERRAQAAETARRTHLGRKRSDLTRQRLSDSLRGRKISAAVVEAVRQANVGRRMPDGTRAAIRASRLRAVLVWPVGSLTPIEFPEVRQAITFIGRPHATVSRWLKVGSPAGMPALAYLE
jgi:hypothetical protein